ADWAMTRPRTGSLPRAMHNCRRPILIGAGCFSGARGTGKSHSMSAAVHTAVRAGITRIHFIAPTTTDFHDVNVEGKSGIFATCGRDPRALGVLAATAGMAQRRDVRVLLGRRAGIVARAASGNGDRRRNSAYALSAKRVRYDDDGPTARRPAARSHRHHTAHHAIHEKAGSDGRHQDHDRLNL